MYNREHCYSVILAGGIGSRFWPISREKLPKQFLDFTSAGHSFLRFTYDRMKAIVPEENILVVSLNRYRDLVKQQLPELRDGNLLLEEYNRNTAPAITYATYKILKRDPDAVMISTPADHVINHHDIFNETIHKALADAEESGSLTTIGIVPTRPDPNFGYIQAIGDQDSGKPLKVKTFTEKPDEELAKVFMESGEFLWNSGIFLWKASVIREELEKHAPDITRLWTGWEDALDTDREADFVMNIYRSDCPRISIDYAVMEKTDKAWVFPAKFKWADIGNWESLYEYLAQHDSFGNASDIDGKSLLREGRDNIIYSDGKGKLIAIRGLEDYIVIDTDDVLLICPRDEKKLKEFLSELAMPEYADYR